MARNMFSYIASGVASSIRLAWSAVFCSRRSETSTVSKSPCADAVAEQIKVAASNLKVSLLDDTISNAEDKKARVPEYLTAFKQLREDACVVCLSFENPDERTKSAACKRCGECHYQHDNMLQPWSNIRYGVQKVEGKLELIACHGSELLEERFRKLADDLAELHRSLQSLNSSGDATGI